MLIWHTSFRHNRNKVVSFYYLCYTTPTNTFVFDIFCLLEEVRDDVARPEHSAP